MKKWYGGVFFASFFMLLVLGYYVMKSTLQESSNTAPLLFNASTNLLEWINTDGPPVARSSEDKHDVVSAETLISNLFAKRNLPNEDMQSMLAWNHLQVLFSQPTVLPNALEAVKEANAAWDNLLTSVANENLRINGSSQNREKDKQCPHFLSNMNVTEHDNQGFQLRVPCGLTEGSSITIIGIPSGLLGNFRIDLTGEHLPGEPDPPMILHYNVRLHGDKITEDPVIVQNTWTSAHEWGAEERCPNPTPERNKKVDELDQCNHIIGKEDNHTARHSNISMVQDGSTPNKHFPFKLGYLFVATLRVGTEGIQMTVDGKHVTSFGFREALEPWLVNEVRVSGDVQLISVVASGLPTSEDVEHIIDIEALKAPSFPRNGDLHVFIGVFSTANNFKRRMAVRRTWMQYKPVRSGQVVVRFFVGLHKNQLVNEELWNEARTYGDIQLMPFVDYYSLITWKTLAICIFGTEAVAAKFIMKTDDDAFVRVDEIVASLDRINTTRGLLYGLINSDSQPHRNPESKWYISPEEYPEDNYPPWAHGPGYVVSSDIAKAIYKRYREGQLKMFKLEDVAMGIWIANLKKEGLEVRYEKDQRVFIEGCKDGYIIAHYQAPQELMCLWQKLQELKRPNCCGG